MHYNVFVQSDKVAAGLHAMGVKKGDRVGIWGPNTWEWILAQFGCGRGGFILVRMSFCNLFKCRKLRIV